MNMGTILIIPPMPKRARAIGPIIGHRLRPPFFPKSFSIDMRIKRLALINIQDSLKSSFNSTISKYKSKLIARIFSENRTPPQLSISNHPLFRTVLSNNIIYSSNPQCFQIARTFIINSDTFRAICHCTYQYTNFNACCYCSGTSCWPFLSQRLMQSNYCAVLN